MNRDPQLYCPVKQLATDVVHRIAAGEVVDRPASALKELVENSIDAGAKRIKVNIVDGGLRLIEVEDDGWGLSHEDLKLCLNRHATSKIRSVEDLDRVLSLGFRGEALAAISSVSQLEIESFSKFQKEAWRLSSTGGAQVEIEPCSRKKGTRMSVKELFFNAPARRKFLKSIYSEASASVSTLNELAIAHPEIHFEWYIVNDKGELKNHAKYKAEAYLERCARIFQIPPEEMLEDNSQKSEEGVHQLKVLFTKVPRAFSHSKNIYLVVNGRVVHDKRLAFSLREAYSGLIEVGRFPGACVHLEINPEQIDINIHPQKREIRWPMNFSLASMVYKRVRPYLSSSEHRLDSETTEKGAPQKEENLEESSKVISLKASKGAGISRALEKNTTYSETSTVLPMKFFEKKWVDEKASFGELKEQGAAYRRVESPQFSDLKIVGEVGASWLVCESKQGMIILDQHAAHERVNFEKFLNNSSLIRSKPLLVTEEIKVPLALQDQKEKIKRALEDWAFELSDSELEKKGVIEVLAVPSADRKINWVETLEEVFNRLESGDSLEAMKEKLKTKIAASLACHGSIRRGRTLEKEEIQQLLVDLDKVRWGGFCPHGRPVWVELSHEKLEEMFHRS